MLLLNTEYALTRERERGGEEEEWVSKHFVVYIYRNHPKRTRGVSFFTHTPRRHGIAIPWRWSSWYGSQSQGIALSRANCSLVARSANGIIYPPLFCFPFVFSRVFRFVCFLHLLLLLCVNNHIYHWETKPVVCQPVTQSVGHYQCKATGGMFLCVDKYITKILAHSNESTVRVAFCR